MSTVINSHKVFSPSSGDQSPRSRCGQGQAPLNALGKKPSLRLPASGGPRHRLAHGSITPVSDSVFTWPSSLCLSSRGLLKELLSLDFGPIGIVQDGLILGSLTTSAKTVFPINLHSQVPGVRNGQTCWGLHLAQYRACQHDVMDPHLCLLLAIRTHTSVPTVLVEL